MKTKCFIHITNKNTRKNSNLTIIPIEWLVFWYNFYGDRTHWNEKSIERRVRVWLSSENEPAGIRFICRVHANVLSHVNSGSAISWFFKGKYWAIFSILLGKSPLYQIITRHRNTKKVCICMYLSTFCKILHLCLLFLWGCFVWQY